MQVRFPSWRAGRVPTWIVFVGIALLWQPPSAWSQENISRHVLKNGLTVLVAERHTLPTVHVSMAIQSGSVLEPREKAGLANMTATLLDEGTQKRTSQQIAEEIDFIGGSIGASGGMDFSAVSLTVLKKDIAQGFDLLSDILLHPAFPQEELDRKRQEILGGIMSEKTDPGSVASKTFQELVFQEHPYSHPIEGTEESLPIITRQDITQFYQTYFRPNRTIMVIVGDLTASEAIQLVKGSLGAWEKKDVTQSALPVIPRPTDKTVKLIQRDITQANIILGHPGISRDNPDYYAVWVMNYILGGGGFSSRLTTEVRENRGLAYGVYSMFDARKSQGAFRVTLQTKNESANEALTLIRQEIARIQKEEVTDEELADAKDYLTGSFPLKLDTNSKMANFLTSVEFYNLGMDYIQEYPKKIQAVTKKDVLSAAKKYLDPEHYTLVVVGRQDVAKIRQ